MFSFVAARVAGMALAVRGGRFVKSTAAVGRPLPFSGADSGADSGAGFAEGTSGGDAELGTEGATGASAGFLAGSVLFFCLFCLAAATGSGGRVVVLVLVLTSVGFFSVVVVLVGNRAGVSP